MSTVAMQGHMNPMLKFAKCLASKGVHVTIATTDVARHLIMSKSKNSPTTASENPSNNSDHHHHSRIKLEFYSDGLSPEFDRNSDVARFLDSLRTVGYKNLSDLVAAINEEREVSCMVFNPFMPWMAEVATDHDIPSAALWIQASTIYSIYYRYFENPSLFGDLENPNGQAIELPGMPALAVQDLPTFILPSGHSPVKSALAEFYRNLSKVNWILGASFYELEEDVVNSMASLHPIYPIGPLVSSFLLGKEETALGLDINMWSVEESCIDWLDKQPPSSVIYVAFGSLTVLTQSHVDGIATALRNVDRPFLWVLKPPEKGSEEEIGRLPPEFLEETKEKGLVVAWCPQEKVLMHRSVACFMTHAGWNSTLEAVAAGVPAVAYPKWTDQATNARLIADAFKVGVSVRRGEDRVASAEEVERCILEVVNGPRSGEIKKRAVELKEKAKKAVQSGGSSDKNIDQFIKEIGAKKRQIV